MRTIAVVNAKGGVGKTTVAVTVAAGLAARGSRVLLVDLDPQGNATQWLTGASGCEGRGAADALCAGLVEPIQTERERLHILPASPGLSGADIRLSQEVGGQTVLRSALAGVADRFDFVLLDCPPSLGLTVLSALCASDHVLCPVLPAFLSLAGLRRIEDLARLARERLNVPVEVLGYVLFGVDAREAITSEARDLLRQQAGMRLFKSEIRVSTAAKSLPAHRATAFDPGADARGLTDYSALLEELLARIQPKSTTTKQKGKRRSA